MKKNILLTGRPRVGKSTLVLRVVERLRAEGLKEIGGFYTLEVSKGGARTGFSINTLDGRTGRLAEAGFESRYRLGRYGIDMESFEHIALSALEEAMRRGGLIVVDEIGYMELKSGRFRELITEALSSHSPLLATIMLSGYGFTDSIKARGDADIIRVNALNREELAIDISEKIRGLIPALFR